MQRHNSSRSSKFLCRILFAVLSAFLLISLLTVNLLSSNISYYHFTFNAKTAHKSQTRLELPYSVRTQISDLQIKVGALLENLHNKSSNAQETAQISDQVLHIALQLDKLAHSLSIISPVLPSNETEMSKIYEDLTEPEENEDNTLERSAFNSAELRNYTATRTNRQIGKKIFFGVDAISPSIGLACTHMSTNIDRFMSYKLYEKCPDDSDLAQKLIANGCDPLPRRRCLSRTPQKYSKPLPINSSMWTDPSDENILWSHYKCKKYSCLTSKESNKGFFKCADCFNLSKKGWEIPTNESASAEFTIDEVLQLKPGEIRVGLDFSPTTGTFAALMRERNVTIASATLNLGAPFNEVIALRGLLPLYLSIGSRLPFFDNTLDIVHSTLFLDGWISVEFLQFVLFDWDRVLRPKGILWVDRFFCKTEDMKVYLDEFGRLGYKKILWRVVPKTDKLENELFLSAVLEKPIRS